MTDRRILVARYAFAVASIAVLVGFVDVDELVTALRDTRPLIVVAGIGVGYVAWLVNTLKWQLLLACRGVRASVGKLFRLNLVAALYGTVLPGQVAGEAVKLFRLAREPRDRTVLVSSVVVDRITGLVGLVVVGLLGAALSDDEPRVVVFVLALGLCGCLAFGAWVLRPRAPRTRSATGLRARVGGVADRLMDALAEYRSVRRSLGIAVLISIVFQGLVTSNIFVFASALGLDLGLADLAWIVSVVSVVQLLPVTIAAIGTRDAAFIVLLATIGIGRADAVALSLLMLVGNISVALGGAVSEFWPDRRAADSGEVVI